jgi:hypothetical protein
MEIRLEIPMVKQRRTVIMMEKPKDSQMVIKMDSQMEKLMEITKVTLTEMRSDLQMEINWDFHLVKLMD